MLLIYAPADTPRLRYTISLVFGDLLEIPCRLTLSAEEFTAYPGPGMAYGIKPAGDGLYLAAAPLLFESTLSQTAPAMAGNGRNAILFPTHGDDSAPGFDPLAAIFYMVSRYEEYKPVKRDKFGRYPASESIASTGGFLEEPMVHLWAEKLGMWIRSRFPEFPAPAKKFRFVPTIDIDHAYAFRYRPLLRTLGGFGRALLSGKPADAFRRIRVLTGLANDPFDTFSYIRETHTPYGSQPLYFYLFADHGGDDNNIPVSHPATAALLRQIDDLRGVGIHPSLSSNKQLLRLETEVKGLQGVLKRPVTNSRQHFLKLSFPKTYRSLIQLGITDDFSMGYASHPGFRAGIAIPYRYFDLERNEVAPLTIHPVTVMDVTLKDYLRLSPEESLTTIGRLIDKVVEVGGEFVSLWHNESLCDCGRWKGWRTVYEEMLRLTAAARNDKIS